MADLSAIEGLRNQIKGSFVCNLSSIRALLTRNSVDNVFIIALALETTILSSTDIHVMLYASETHWHAAVAGYEAVTNWMGLAIMRRPIYFKDCGCGADNEVEALRHLLRLTSEEIHEIRDRARRDFELARFLEQVQRRFIDRE